MIDKVLIEKVLLGIAILVASNCVYHIVSPEFQFKVVFVGGYICCRGMDLWEKSQREA